MKPVELELTLLRSTKGTHVYGDDREGAVMPSVYIKKAGLPADPPAKLRVTLEAATDAS